MKYEHPIRAVAKQTGLSNFLIRMWERRYKAVNPKRTESGHRLYSDDDIFRLRLLRQATLLGESIGRIAQLTNDELSNLISASAKSATPVSQSAKDGGADYHLALCMEAIRNLDSINLESRLLTASVALGQETLFEKVLQPALIETGELWADGTLKVAHEHLASAVIRSLLGSMIVTNRSVNQGPALIATTPVGQLHEFGSLMASVTAASIGWRPVYLGPNCPAEDIAAAAKQYSARSVILSLVYPSDDPIVMLELKKLRRQLGESVNILIGGRAASHYKAQSEDQNLILVESLKRLREVLHASREKGNHESA